MSVGLTTTAILGDLSGYFFRIFRDKPSSIIWRHATPCRPVTDSKMKIDPYYQWQKCSPMNLVSENTWFMQIFAGVALGGGIKPHWGLSTTSIFGDLGGYVFENFRDTASNNMWRYATPCRPANDCKMNDPEWPWVAISWQNAFSASTSWIRAFECQN